MLAMLLETTRNAAWLVCSADSALERMPSSDNWHSNAGSPLTMVASDVPAELQAPSRFCAEFPNMDGRLCRAQWQFVQRICQPRIDVRHREIRTNLRDFWWSGGCSCTGGYKRAQLRWLPSSTTFLDRQPTPAALSRLPVTSPAQRTDLPPFLRRCLPRPNPLHRAPRPFRRAAMPAWTSR